MKYKCVWIIVIASLQFSHASDLDSAGTKLNMGSSGAVLLTDYRESLAANFDAREQLGLSAESASGSQEGASRPSCAVNTSDVAVPTTGNDIQMFVTGYGSRPKCIPRLHAALEGIFAAENRVEKWAGPLERIIKDAAVAVHGATITGSCHTSLCLYDIELTPSVESTESPNEIDRRVIDAAAGTPFAVESIHYGPALKYRTYFYSTVVPAAFVQPLRKKMESDK